MKTNRTFIIATLFVLAIPVIPNSLHALEFSPDEITNLSQGKIVRKPLPASRKNGFYGGTGFAVVDASPEVVWRFLKDWAAYAKAFPRTVEVKALATKENRSLVRMKLGYKILSVKYHLSVKSDWKKKTISFNLAENRPHDIQATRGYWRLLPQPDGRTLVVYGIAVQIPMGIVAFLGDKMEKAMEDDLIGAPKYVKRFVEGSTGVRYHKLTASVGGAKMP